MSAMTTLAMRTLAEEQGCGLTVTEFLPAAALAARNRRFVARLTPSADGRPFGVQIFGRDPKQMYGAAQLAVDVGASLVDINMGCPGKKVSSGSCGAALMLDPVLASELVAAVRQATAGAAETTAKMRAGWDEHDRNAPELAARLVAAGAAAITVHGRTRMQRYQGRSDCGIIARVKQAVAVPVIANGDIVDERSCARVLGQTGADGVMIGRAALGNPWIFARLRGWFEGGPRPAPPTDRERISMYLRHLELELAGEADPKRVTIEMRKFAAHYLSPLPDAQQLLQRIYRETDPTRVREWLRSASEPWTDRSRWGSPGPQCAEQRLE
jgi:tRNA-dihydrouridine synthase B